MAFMTPRQPSFLTSDAGVRGRSSIASRVRGRAMEDSSAELGPNYPFWPFWATMRVIASPAPGGRAAGADAAFFEAGAARRGSWQRLPAGPIACDVVRVERAIATAAPQIQGGCRRGAPQNVALAIAVEIAIAADAELGADR